MNRAVLVTGGAGYIGSHACKALKQAGWTPIAYDNLSTGHAYAVKWGPFIHADIADKPRLIETLASFRPCAVLHFAADALVVESSSNPAKYYRNNLANTLALLEAMREQSIDHLVFSSTCATYGAPQFTPMTEEHPQKPINPYGRTKWMAEQMMADFAAAYGIKPVFMRYFNAAGADLQTEIGENHSPETHLIPSVIQAALGQRPEIVVYGTDFDTRDGSAIRDYVHVSDLAAAHVKALEYLLQGGKPDAFNLGTGVGTSVLELVSAVEKQCGVKVPLRLEGKRPGEPGILAADFAKAKKILGWEPSHSSLEQILDSAWKWHQLLAEKAPLLRNAMQRIEESRWSSSPSS